MNGKQLKKTIALLKPFKSSNSNNGTEFLAIKAEEGNIIFGMGNEAGYVQVTGPSGENDFNCLINFNNLWENAKNISPKDDISLDYDDEKSQFLIITNSIVRRIDCQGINIKTHAADIYLWDLTENKKEIMNGDEFNNALLNTVFSVSFDDARPDLNYVIFKDKKAVSTDAFRISIYDLEGSLHAGKEFWIHRKIGKYIIKNFPKQSTAVFYDKEILNNHPVKISYTLGSLDVAIFPAQCDGNFPDWEAISVINQENKKEFAALTFPYAVTDLLPSRFRKNDTHLIKFYPTKEDQNVIYKYDEGQVDSTMDLETKDGKVHSFGSMQVTFNAQYMKEFLNAPEVKKSESIIMYTRHGRTAKAHDMPMTSFTGKLTHVLMPMNITD